MSKETIVDVFPGQNHDHRLVIASKFDQDSGGQCFVLRQETHSADVGWFTQSRLQIEPEQLAGLKMVLTSGVLTLGTPEFVSTPPGDGESPSILPFAKPPTKRAS